MPRRLSTARQFGEVSTHPQGHSIASEFGDSEALHAITSDGVARSPFGVWVLAKVVDFRGRRRRACVYSLQADSRDSGFGFGADGNGLCRGQLVLRQSEAVISKLSTNDQMSGNASIRCAFMPGDGSGSGATSIRSSGC
jgi:hypothetical protein